MLLETAIIHRITQIMILDTGGIAHLCLHRAYINTEKKIMNDQGNRTCFKQILLVLSKFYLEQVRFP